MTGEESFNSKRAEIKRIAARHGVSDIRLFGSSARGESTRDSDFDFLIDVTSETSAWFPAGLIQDLEKLLGRRVEVVTERSLNKDLREQVLRDAIPV